MQSSSSPNPSRVRAVCAPASSCAGEGCGQSLKMYLESASAVKWQWGSHDCCTFGSGWVRLQTGIDPLAEFRGAYNSAAQASRLIAANGGMRNMVADRLPAGYGLLQSSSNPPEDGDIALLAVKSGRLGVGWAVLLQYAGWWAGLSADRGVRYTRATPTDFWRLAR